MLACLDQALHLVPPSQSTVDSATAAMIVHQSRALLQAPDGVDWHARIAHLATYPAAYYAYPLDRAISRAIWLDFFDRDPLEGQAGHKLKSLLLAPGGARPPLDILHLLIEHTCAHEKRPSNLITVIDSL